MCTPEDCLKCNQGRDCPNLPIQYADEDDWPWTLKTFLLALGVVACIGAVCGLAVAGRLIGGEW